MLLAIDIGNSNIVVGVFADDKLIANWRLQTDYNKSADEYGMILKQLFEHENLRLEEISGAIIATVVPSVLFTVQHLCAKYFNKQPLVVGPGLKTGLHIKYDNPKQVGADRIVNAVAAYSKFGGPLIIIDFGTATTFCAISAEAEYLGGSIAPGLKISSDAIFEKTAQLPKVELEDPGCTICKNTSDSMKSGLVYGHMGMIEFIVEKMKAEIFQMYGDNCDVTVVATGGLSSMIEKGVKCIDQIDKTLTLDGLQLIYKKNIIQ